LGGLLSHRYSPIGEGYEKGENIDEIGAISLSSLINPSALSRETSTVMAILPRLFSWTLHDIRQKAGKRF